MPRSVYYAPAPSLYLAPLIGFGIGYYSGDYDRYRDGYRGGYHGGYHGYRGRHWR